MSDLLDVCREALTCPFCRVKFSDVIKFIPDCGSFICGACYDELTESLDRSKQYNCNACGDQHILPENGLSACKQIAGLLRQSIEKPLSEKAKKLKHLIENVQDEMTRVEAFDPRDHIEQHCVQLELEVNQAAESAVNHIHEMETDLLKKIQNYRQRCLDSLADASSSSKAEQEFRPWSPISDPNMELDSLSKEIKDFSIKWNGYFKRLNTLASDSEIDAAIDQTEIVQSRLAQLDQEMRSRAFRESTLQFNLNSSFFSAKDHLGELVEKLKKKGICLQEPIRTLIGHSEEVNQIIQLQHKSLASSSDDALIKIWNATSGNQLHELSGHTGPIYSLAVLLNGWLASGSADSTIKLWDLEERKEVRTLEGHTDSIASLSVLSNGNLVSYSTDGTFRIWNPYLEENNLLRIISGHGNQKHVIPFGVLSNDFLVACCLSDEFQESLLKVWNPANGKVVKSRRIGLEDILQVLVLSNDQVAIGTESGFLKLFDLEDERKTRTQKIHDQWVSCICQLSNDNLVSTGHDLMGKDLDIYSIKVWSITNLRLLQVINTDHSETIFSICASDDESLLFSGSSDKTIKLWPISTGQHNSS